MSFAQETGNHKTKVNRARFGYIQSCRNLKKDHYTETLAFRCCHVLLTMQWSKQACQNCVGLFAPFMNCFLLKTSAIKAMLYRRSSHSCGLRLCKGAQKCPSEAADSSEQPVLKMTCPIPWICHRMYHFCYICVSLCQNAKSLVGAYLPALLSAPRDFASLCAFLRTTYMQQD